VQTISVFFKQRWELFVLLIIFIICKTPHLHYPFYWDESWPYAPAVKQMYVHGPSLMPDAVDSLLSRGHPLFFHAAAAAWMDIFGTTQVVIHSFALFVSIAFLIAIHEACFSLYNRRVAVLSTVLVAIQVMYFVQSSLLLFEIMVAFLAFLSIYFYTTRSYLLTAIFLSMLFYTKESGIIAGVAIGMDVLVRLFSKETVREKMMRVVCVAIPFAAIAIFFLVQKHLRGWYVFPLYSDNLEHTWGAFYIKFRSTLFNIFTLDHRYYYFNLLLALSVLTAIVKRDIRYAVLLLPAVCIYIMADDRLSQHTYTRVMFSVFILASLYANYTLARLKYGTRTPETKFILLGTVFSICFLAFSSVNLFLIYRYLFPVIILMLVFSGIYLDELIRALNKALFYPILALLLLIGFLTFKLDTGHGDTNLGAFHAMHVQQSAVSYMEKTGDYNAPIGVGGFLVQQHLLDSNTGFLRLGKNFTDVDWRITDNTKYIITDNIEPSNLYERLNTDTSFHRVYRYEEGDTWTEIYKRSGKPKP